MNKEEVDKEPIFCIRCGECTITCDHSDDCIICKGNQLQCLCWYPCKLHNNGTLLFHCSCSKERKLITIKINMSTSFGIERKTWKEIYEFHQKRNRKIRSFSF